jgi:ketosteroid isomerase-like protein
MSDEQAILDTEARRCQALADVDIDVLDVLFSDALTHIHTTGLVQTKAEFLAGLDANRPFVRVERGDLTVRVIGDCAVITGSMTNLVRRPGHDQPVVMEGYATQVLSRENGAWRYVVFQATTGPKLPQLLAAA